MSSLQDLAERLDPPSSGLKRLSLVSKSQSLVLSESRSATNANHLHPIHIRQGGPCTPGRDLSKRSSIVYSPRLSSALGSLAQPTPQSAVSRMKGESSRTEDTRDTKETRETRAETLMDRHADLLTMIAEKERRVNELKQELAHQQSALAQLKSKWVQIASRQPPPTQSPSSAITRIRPTSPAVVTAGSSKRTSSPSSVSLTSMSLKTAEESLAVSTPSQTHSLDASIAQLFAQIQTEGIGGEALEGGKRFFGQLVKTVSAAASGTIPGAERQGNGPFDLSGLKGMIPSSLPLWSESTSQEQEPPTERPPLPSNSSRLNTPPAKRGHSQSSTGGSGSLLPSSIEEDLLGGDEASSSNGILAPRRKETVNVDEKRGETAESREGMEEDGWGW